MHSYRNTVAALAAIAMSVAGSSNAAAPRELDAQQTVVVANRNVPESIDLAHYYIAARGIPEANLCLVDLPVGETMSRWYYEKRLREPLQDFLRGLNLIEQVRREDENLGPNDNPWRTVRSQLRYIVSMYGVPLRIAESRPFLVSKIARLTEAPFHRDGAAVDSELACMLWESYPIMGYQNNPMYNLVYWTRNDHQIRPIVMAARLDGPDPDSVRRMIDDTINAEKDGLNGRGYVDLRSIKDPDYILGDFWLREASERLSRAGYDVLLDVNDGLFAADVPMPDAVFYFGWYAENVEGPFLRDGFRFRPGAIAYHLHSASAKTLRSRNRYWAGPLLAAGAAAVMGAVDEPYLAFTPDVQIFVDRLCAGLTFGEAAYFSQRALSWQITVVGDPLYRPFSLSVDESIAAMSASGSIDVEWQHVKKINLLISQQRFNVALNYAREVLKRSNSLVIREKLADLYARNELWAEAIREYEQVVTDSKDESRAISAGQRLILLLRGLHNADAERKIRDLLENRWPDSPLQTFLDVGTP